MGSLPLLNLSTQSALSTYAPRTDQVHHVFSFSAAEIDAVSGEEQSRSSLPLSFRAKPRRRSRCASLPRAAETTIPCVASRNEERRDLPCAPLPLSVSRATHALRTNSVMSCIQATLWTSDALTDSASISRNLARCKENMTASSTTWTTRSNAPIERSTKRFRVFGGPRDRALPRPS